MKEESESPLDDQNTNETTSLKNGGTGSNDSQEEDNCDLKIFEQVDYFDGQLLTKDDFKQDQRYYNDKRHLLNKFVTGPGIVYGLRISVAESNLKTDGGEEMNEKASSQMYLDYELTRGVAIDECGREIVVPSNQKRRLKIDRVINDSPNGDSNVDDSGTETIRLGLFLQRKRTSKNRQRTYIPNDADRNKEEFWSRKLEDFDLHLKKIKEFPIVLEFDRKSYSMYDKVVIELFDPDNSLSGDNNTNPTEGNIESGENESTNEIGSSEENIEVNVSSSVDKKGFSLSLTKNKNYENLYQGFIHLVKDGSKSESQFLQVENGGFISARMAIKNSEDSAEEENSEDSAEEENSGTVLAHAFVSIAEPSIVDNTPFLINSRNMLEDYYKYRDNFLDSKGNTSSRNDYEELNKSGVLLGVFKVTLTKEQGKLIMNKPKLAQQETYIYRKNILSHHSLFELVKENFISKKEYPPLINSTIISNIYQVKLIDLKPNTYLITDPIQFFPKKDFSKNNNNPNVEQDTTFNEKYPNMDLEYPPLIYVGRAYDDDQDGKVMYYEDIDFNIIINSKKYKASEATKKDLEKLKLHLIQSVSFKPIEITRESFRLLITKDYDTEVSQPSKLYLRWWAICQFTHITQ